MYVSTTTILIKQQEQNDILTILINDMINAQSQLMKMYARVHFRCIVCFRIYGADELVVLLARKLICGETLSLDDRDQNKHVREVVRNVTILNL